MKKEASVAEADMYLIDSSCWIEFFGGGPSARLYKKYINNSDHILTPSIVCFEVYRVLRRQLDEVRALKAVATLSTTQQVPLDESLAVYAGDISISFNLARADAIIYATAKLHGAQLVTSDQDFKGLDSVIYIPKPKKSP